MPERRKMKSPSPKMTSTPKMKRKEVEREDSATSDIQKRLGFSENLAPKKEFSTPGVELTEYNDGTTRPMFKKRLKSVTANSGEMAQLECVVSGSPLPKILWLKNSRPLKASDGCKVVVDEGSNILVFPNARDEDVGTYTARAMNVNGSIMCSAEFSLTDGRGQPAQPILDSPMDMDFTTPAYFFQMSSCEVSEGRLARFDCRVVAYPRPEIVWMRDGKVVEAADRFKLLNFNNEIYSLLIQDVRLTDTGRYTCWARNKFGEAMTEAYLNVIGLTEEKDDGDIAPKFLTRFYDQQTTEGCQTDFKCLVAGRPEPSVTWLINEGELQDQAGVRTRHKDGVVSLEIKKPKLDHSGQYTCQLKNPLGDAACSAKLIVVEDKLRGKMLPKFLRKFDHVNAKDGEEVKFTCVIVGEPRPEVQWMFDHKPISDTNRHFSMKQEGDSYTLIVKGVRYDDAGKITCKASNEEGEVYCSANLHVREPKYVRDTPEKTGVLGRDEVDSRFGYVPTFTKRLHDVEAKEGSKAMFECRVMGIPDPEISWMKDGRVIVPGGRYHMTSVGGTCEMTIDNITPQDAGVYTCIISNIQGKSSSTASLKLEEPEKKKERFTPEKTLDDRLSRKDRYTPDKYLLEDTGVKRTYPEFDKYDTGVKCTYPETDKYDYDSRRGLELPEMRAPPRLPTHRPIITDLGEETVRLAWRPVETYQAKRTPPVSYSLEARELPGKDWMPLSSRLRDTSHYLSDLPYDRDYMIRVRAENDFGVSEPTEPLWLPRARAFPGVPVTRPKITDYEDTSVRLSWTRVDIPTFHNDESPLLYMIEVEEPPSRDWRTVASDLDDTEYLVEGLSPGQDYRFRVRAKSPRGVVSEPSPAVSLYTALARSHAPVDRLEVLKYEPDTSSVQLSWQRVDIPPYNRDDEPLMYMLEYQDSPLPDWKPLVTGIPTTRYRVMHLDSDRDYKFRVRAFTPYGVSPPSPVLPVTLRQSPISRPLPEAVIISEVEPDSLRLSWRRPMTDLSQPISYQIEMLEPPSTNWQPIATRVTDTNYKVTGLRPTRDYQFRVIPQSGTGYLEPTSSAALTTMPVRPRLPMTEPTLRELTPESVQLSWRPAEFPAYQRTRTPIYYKVEMAEQPTNNWVPVARRLPDTSYNVTGLKPDHDYKFRIVAETDSGFSEPSLPSTLYRRPVPRFATTEPLIKDISQNTVTLAWTPAEVPHGDYSVAYQVEVQTPPGISSWRTLYNNHPTPTVRLADLRPDLDYLVRVRAQSGTYLSEPTLPVYIPRRAAPPRLPQEEPYAIHIGSDHIKLQWRSADLPSQILDYAPVTYRLEAQELPNTNWVTIARGITHTDFKVTGLKPQQDYSFRIRAENEYGVSDATRPMVMKKRSVAPHLPIEQPLMYDYGPGSVRLSWRPASLPSYATSTSPLKYSIFVQEHPFTSWRPLVRGIPHTSYHVTGLNPDKEYKFRVQAENEYGTSKPSDSVHLLKYAVAKLEPKDRDTDLWRPISMPEISDYDDDLTSLKIRWRPTPAPHFDTAKLPGRYTVERWEPVKREWSPVARGIPDTSYHVRDLPRFPDHVFRVRMDSELPDLHEPSLPVSSRFNSTPRVPIYRPQLYEVDADTVKLSWQPVHLPDAGARRAVRYSVEQREIPEPRWYPAVSDINDTHCKIRGLRPKLDYEFRVKAIIDGLPSEPSLPVSLYRKAVIPNVRFDAPEVYDMDDSSLSLRWNTVDVPAFKNDEEPLMFIIERQTLPEYEWQPIATNVSDSSYRVQGLEPYRDYNFRVRGAYPSGFTEPSPYVPVYRRPSESKLGVYAVESRSLVSKSTSSQKYVPSFPDSKVLPRKTYEFDYKKHRQMSPSPRRYTLSNIFEIDSYQPLSRSAPIPEPKFRREDAYVYRKSRSPSKLPDAGPIVHLPKTTPAPKKTTLDTKYDLYSWYLKHRRFSEAGLEELQKNKARSRKDLMFENQRRDILLESQRQTPVVQRRSSYTPHPRAAAMGMTEPGVKDPSVADRYEDIKTPYILEPEHWKFARRHSVALDYEDQRRVKKIQEDMKKAANIRSRSHKPRPKTDLDLISKTQDEYFGGTHFVVEDEVKFNNNNFRPTYQRRSHSQERDPGYFMISKFSLAVSGVRKSIPTRHQSLSRDSYVRPASLEPSPIIRSHVRSSSPDIKSWAKTRSLTPDLYEVTRTRSYTPDMDDIRRRVERRSYLVSQELDRPIFRKSSISRPTVERSPVRRQSPPRTSVSRSQATAFIKPRSYSISVPSAEVKFNKHIEDSKSLITRYENLDHKSGEQISHSRATSVARTTEESRFRSGSVADIRSDPRFSASRRGSLAARPTIHPDVKSDPRFTSQPRGSLSSTAGDRSRSASTHNLDPRFARRRSSLAASTNEDLKSKLDTLTSKMSTLKPKKSSRPVIKFKSSKGTGYVAENDWQPQSTKLSSLYNQLK